MTKCDMGVGCDEVGACYAESIGEPERCPLLRGRTPQQIYEQVCAGASQEFDDWMIESFRRQTDMEDNRLRVNDYQWDALQTSPGVKAYEAMPERIGHRDPEKVPMALIHGVMGVSSEAGELSDAVKKSLIYGTPLDTVNILEECGDLLWYIAITLNAAGFTMEEAMRKNLAKLRARYPGGFSEKSATTRDLDAERKALEG